MAYRFKRKEPLEAGVRRIAREQLELALGELYDQTLDTKTQVHQARQRLKKLRALLRLVRPALGKSYKKLNDQFRDMGRELSELRDADVRIVTTRKLGNFSKDPETLRIFQVIEDFLLTSSIQHTGAGLETDRQLELFALRLEALHREAATWRLSCESDDVLFTSLYKTYKQCRQAGKAAIKTPSDIHLHQWRKRVKDHWYHTCLLRNVWKPIMEARASELSRLADLLGDDHDVAMLLMYMKNNADQIKDSGLNQLQMLKLPTLQYKERLQKKAFSLGQRIFSEPPPALQKRIHSYWKIWRS